MTGLDTNVLVRYLVEDDDEQAQRAATLISSIAENEESLFIAQIVLCELVWVLERAYGQSRQQVASILDAVLRTAQFVVEDVEQAWRALARYSRGKAGFADYLIAERAKAAGCEQVATFDQDLLAGDGFVAP